MNLSIEPSASRIISSFASHQVLKLPVPKGPSKLCQALQSPDPAMSQSFPRVHPAVRKKYKKSLFGLFGNGRVRAGAETPLNIREKFGIRVSPRTILKIFSAVDTQTAVLVSTAEVWISAPDTQTPIFLVFLGIHS